MDDQRKVLTRRQFVLAAAATGGTAAGYVAMRGLGLVGSSSETNSPLAGRVTDKRVIIIGAGLAGMCAAHELGKVGYDCHLLEARDRAGGRCWTVRNGTQHEELSGTIQTAEFEPGLYFNPGPARIPQHHHTTLNYCKEFGVNIELFSNLNEAAYYHEDFGPLGGRRLRIREAKTDMRGHMSELMAKSVDSDALDVALTAADKSALLDFLFFEGDLTPERIYESSTRRGYTTYPGAGQNAGEVADPYGFSDLLGSRAVGLFSADYNINQQMSMFQIVGGTDRLAMAFASRVDDLVTYGAQVTEIRKTPDGVRVIYSDASGESVESLADYCVCTVPLPVLSQIESDFSVEMKAAMRQVSYVPTGKIGLQFSRRFWEEDDRIFGGISRTSMAINQVWYPSSDYLGARGILVGYYNFGADARAVGRLSPSERETLALDSGRKIHPQYDEGLETSYSVSWHELEHSLGGFASHDESSRRNAYPTLTRPDGRIYLAGEHLSYLTGWMAGAFESALHTVAAIHEHAMSA